MIMSSENHRFANNGFRPWPPLSHPFIVKNSTPSCNRTRSRAFTRRLQLTAKRLRYTDDMEVHLPPEIETKLARMAHQRGVDAQALARTVIESFVDYDDWFPAGSRKRPGADRPRGSADARSGGGAPRKTSGQTTRHGPDAAGGRKRPRPIWSALPITCSTMRRAGAGIGPHDLRGPRRAPQISPSGPSRQEGRVAGTGVIAAPVHRKSMQCGRT